jgi:hypothetical protein
LVVLVISSPVARAQSPSLDSLSILPSAPTVAVDVMAQVGGIYNTSGSPNIRTEIRRIATEIRLDVLIDELPVGAPAQMNPWSRTVSLGLLPAGTYSVDARLFWTYRFVEPQFPTPWLFPDAFGEPLRPGSNGRLTVMFTVVPEPSAVTLLVIAMTLLGVRRTA